MNKLKGKTALVVAIVTECIILGFTALVLIYGGMALTKLTMAQLTASLAIPMGYVYSVSASQRGADCDLLYFEHCISV